MSAYKVAVVILAGGSGDRFGTSIPKQFVSVAGIPVFIHALRTCAHALRRHTPIYLIVVPRSYEKKACSMIERHSSGLPFRIVSGGERRIDSYFKAIECLNSYYPDVGTVITHDGARPLVQPSLVSASHSHFVDGKFDAHLTVSSVRESLFKKVKQSVVCLPREAYCLGQTPYVFKRALLEDIHARWRSRTKKLPDETDIFELAQLSGNVSVGYLEARGRNPKLTFPEDIAAIRMMLNKHPHGRR